MPQKSLDAIAFSGFFSTISTKVNGSGSVRDDRRGIGDKHLGILFKENIHASSSLILLLIFTRIFGSKSFILIERPRGIDGIVKTGSSSTSATFSSSLKVF